MRSAQSVARDGSKCDSCLQFRGANVSLNDFANRPARAMNNDETFTTGKFQVPVSRNSTRSPLLGSKSAF